MIVLMILSMVGFKGGYLMNNFKSDMTGSKENAIITQNKVSDDELKLKISAGVVLYATYLIPEKSITPLIGSSFRCWYKKVGVKMEFVDYFFLLNIINVNLLWKLWRYAYVGFGGSTVVIFLYPAISFPVFSIGLEKTLWFNKNLNYFFQLEAGYPWYAVGVGDATEEAPTGWIWKTPPFLMFSIGLNFYTYVF